MDSFGFAVFAAGKLIPGVVGHTVAVGIIAHHHYARLGRAPFVAYAGQLIERVAPDSEVFLARNVHHRVVKRKSDVSAISAERDHHVVGARNRLLDLLQHVGIGIAGFINRHLVDKLARSRAIVDYAGDIWTVLHLFVHHVHREIKLIWRLAVDNLKRQPIGSLRIGYEYIVAAVRHHLAVDLPLISASGKGRIERKLLHAGNDVGIVDSKAYGRNVVGTAGQGKQSEQGID